MTSGCLQGVCADVRHSTHTGHSTDRPSRAPVAESCWSFYGITSSASPQHLGVWQAAAHAWRASALGGLTWRLRPLQSWCMDGAANAQYGCL